jgi:hypothetical protein
VHRRKIETTADLDATIDALVDGWCERRCLRALGWILRAWPTTLAHTDDWGDLRTALRNVLAFARSELTPAEIDAVEEAIAAIDIAVDRGIGRPDWTR